MITITYTNDETGDEVRVELPSKKEVCLTCEGESYVLAPGMRGHAYTQEEFDEAFDDEQRQEYFKRGGIYDVLCPECGGKNVVDAIDEAKLSVEQRVHFDAWGQLQQADAEADAEYEAMCRAERLMGA